MRKIWTLGCLLAATGAYAQTGNVGIGTINPQAQLHTTGTVRFDTLRGTGVRPVYVTDSGTLLTANPQSAINGTAYNIPDGDCSGASSPITITGMPVAVPSSNIRVRINISHVYDGDLDIYLISPSGQILNLAYHNGSGANFTNTIFGDGATQPLSSSSSPFTGFFKPVGNAGAVGNIYTSSGTSACGYAPTITTFAGFGSTVVPNGTWTLKVIDYYYALTGTISDWSISFNGTSNFTQPIQAISANYVPKASLSGTFANSTIYDNGKVGINTTTPAATLDIVGDTLGLRNTAAWDNLWFTVNGSTANINTSGAENGLNFNVGANTSGAYGNGQTLANVMTMSPGGGVGIGTAAPNGRLVVVQGSTTTGVDTAAAIYGSAYGQPASSKGGVYGTYSFGGTAGGAGVQGIGNSGTPLAATGTVFSLYSGNQDYGVYGSGYNSGVTGTSTSSYGVKALSYLTGIYAVGNATGISANAASITSGLAAPTVRTGIYATAGGASTNNYALYASASGTGAYAGYFQGNVQVVGSLSKGGGTFKIDHPLDPANKYLYHSFVESPDMMNIYNGNIITDAQGFATVQLPAYFEAENMDFRYQLTVIRGHFAQAEVDEEIGGNTFRIHTSQPGIKVSWQVTGIRKDAYANAHRVVPEVDKEAQNKGLYLYPAEWGQPASKGIDFRMQTGAVEAPRAGVGR